MLRIPQTSGDSRGNLKILAHTRRFAKLSEDLSKDKNGEVAQTVLDLLEKDIEKFVPLRQYQEKHTPYPNNRILIISAGENGESALYSDAYEDQSDLINPLANRMNVAVMLIGQFKIAEGLPLVLDDIAVRDKTVLANWSNAAYASDKILSSHLLGSMTDEQASIQMEYLEWKESLDEKNRSFFDYERVELPSFRSISRPYGRIAKMGGGIDPAKGYPSVWVEYPPMDFSEDFVKLKGPQVEVVEFARRFVEAK